MLPYQLNISPFTNNIIAFGKSYAIRLKSVRINEVTRVVFSADGCRILCELTILQPIALLKAEEKGFQMNYRSFETSHISFNVNGKFRGTQVRRFWAGVERTLKNEWFGRSIVRAFAVLPLRSQPSFDRFANRRLHLIEHYNSYLMSLHLTDFQLQSQAQVDEATSPWEINEEADALTWLATSGQTWIFWCCDQFYLSYSTFLRFLHQSLLFPRYF